MGDSALRFKALEHPLTMLIAIVLITIGYSKAKRAQTESKAYKALFGFWLAGLLLILLRLPYDAYFSFSH
jgi:membrane protein DedA with SNARE-associated domain